jgi:hypothetical protein
MCDLAAQFRSTLAAADFDTFDGAAAGELAEELARTEKACAAARVRCSIRAAACGEHRRRGFTDVKEWSSRAAGSSVGRAKAELATVEALAELPATRDAVIAGDVSLDQAAEITRVPGHESELLEVARTESLRALKDRARRRRLQEIDRDELAAEQHRARSVRHRLDDELGMRRVDMLLTPSFGTRFTNRLDRETDRVWRAARREGRTLTRAQAAADALERIFDGTAKDGRGHADIVYVVGLAAWACGEVLPGEPCHIVGGGPVPLSQIRREVADAFVKAVVHDGTKVDTIVHYGRRRPALLQSVLDLGPPPDFDGVECAKESCDRRIVQWDHIDPVANGGPTSEENSQPLCPVHHWEKTERDRAAGLLGPDAKQMERGPPPDR